MDKGSWGVFLGRGKGFKVVHQNLKDLENAVHLSQRMEDEVKEIESVVIGSLGGGMSYNFNLHNILSNFKNLVITDPKGEIRPELLSKEGYEEIVIDPKSEYIKNSWNPLMEESGPEGICSAMEGMGFNEKKLDFYLALAGLVNYGGFVEGQDRNLAMMNSLENRPLEELDKIFEHEHRSGKLPVFFYERWKKCRSSLVSVMEVGD